MRPLAHGVRACETIDLLPQFPDSLLECGEAILDRSRDLEGARNACVASIGEDATIQAASIVACFDGINRVADATGIRLDPESARNGASMIIDALELEELGAARA